MQSLFGKDDRVLTKEMMKLSRSGKILLVQDLWTDVAVDRAITVEERQYVAQRLADLSTDHQPLVAWEDLKSKPIRARRTTR